MMVWVYIRYNMLTFFYSLSLLFVWVEVFQFRKKSIIHNDLLSIDHTYVFAYLITKLLSIISIPIGLFTPLKFYYILIVAVEVLKMLVSLNQKSRIINWVNLITIPIYIIIYLIIFIQGVVL